MAQTTREVDSQPAAEPKRVPLAAAALKLSMNRERLLRRVQAGEVRGEQIDGRWYVDAREMPTR